MVTKDGMAFASKDEIKAECREERSGTRREKSALSSTPYARCSGRIERALVLGLGEPIRAPIWLSATPLTQRWILEG